MGRTKPAAGEKILGFQSLKIGFVVVFLRCLTYYRDTCSGICDAWARHLRAHLSKAATRPLISPAQTLSVTPRIPKILKCTAENRLSVDTVKIYRTTVNKKTLSPTLSPTREPDVDCEPSSMSNVC